jgi:uncharacterized protein YecE (DUF72 family)
MFQFPPWFFPGNEQREHILECKKRLGQYRIAVEFRHSSWVNDKNRERTFSFLSENGLCFVCVDEPSGFKSSVPSIAQATAEIAAVRFHGRNAETWEKKGLSAAERFNYLYADEELKEWAPRIESLASKAEQVHVLFNNCYEDKGVRNARRMKAILGQVQE